MVSEHDILNLAKRIADNFEPEQIILFGSHAYGAPTEESDIDLLIVMPFEGRTRAKSLEIWRDVRPRIPVDLLVRTPDEVERQYREWDPLIREAIDKGKVLYERDGEGMAGEIRGRPASRPTGIHR